MTSSNPPCREGSNQFRPLTDASPGSARSPGRRVPRPLRRPPTTAYTLSFERKASPFFANVQSEFTNPLILSAAEIRAAIADFRCGKLSSSRTHRGECGAACKSRPPEGVIGVQKSATSCSDLHHLRLQHRGCSGDADCGDDCTGA